MRSIRVDRGAFFQQIFGNFQRADDEEGLSEDIDMHDITFNNVIRVISSNATTPYHMFFATQKRLAMAIALASGVHCLSRVNGAVLEVASSYLPRTRHSKIESHQEER